MLEETKSNTDLLVDICLLFVVVFLFCFLGKLKGGRGGGGEAFHKPLQCS